MAAPREHAGCKARHWPPESQPMHWTGRAGHLKGRCLQLQAWHHLSAADSTTQDMLDSQRTHRASMLGLTASHNLSHVRTTEQRLTMVRISESTVSVSCKQ